MDKVLLTIEEAAERLSIGRTKAYELVATGALASVTIGRSRRITPAALSELVNRLEAARNECHNPALLSEQRHVADREQLSRTGSTASSPDEDPSRFRGRAP